MRKKEGGEERRMHDSFFINCAWKKKKGKKKYRGKMKA